MKIPHIFAALYLFSAATPGAAALLQITLEGSNFAGSQINIGYRFAGLSGDTIDLPDGAHTVSFTSSNGYRFSVDLGVSGDLIALKSSSHQPPNCVQPKQVSWKTPSLAAPQKVGGPTGLVVPEPSFGPPEGQTSCTLFSMAACNSRKIALTAKSVPSMAEIWIDGKQIPQRTDTTLSVPFCTYEDTKVLVYRLPGQVNCQRTLQLKPDANIEVACQMQPLPSSGK